MQGLIEKIKSDRFAAVSVESIDGSDKPYINYTLSKILSEFKSVEDFFEHINRNFRRYKIIERRQNGTQQVGNRKKINYKTVEVHEPSMFQDVQIMPQQANGMGFPSFGLSIPEIVSYKVDSIEKHRLQSKVETLEKEVERLRNVEREYEKFKIESDFSDKKLNHTTSLISEALSSPVLQNLVQVFATKGTGLASPGTGSNPQPELDDFMRSYLQLDENSKNLFRNILYLSKTKQGFFETLTDLVLMEISGEN